MRGCRGATAVSRAVSLASHHVPGLSPCGSKLASLQGCHSSAPCCWQWLLDVGAVDCDRVLLCCHGTLTSGVVPRPYHLHCSLQIAQVYSSSGLVFSSNAAVYSAFGLCWASLVMLTVLLRCNTGACFAISRCGFARSAMPCYIGLCRPCYAGLQQTRVSHTHATVLQVVLAFNGL